MLTPASAANPDSSSHAAAGNGTASGCMDKVPVVLAAHPLPSELVVKVLLKVMSQPLVAAQASCEPVTLPQLSPVLLLVRFIAPVEPTVALYIVTVQYPLSVMPRFAQEVPSVALEISSAGVPLDSNAVVVSLYSWKIVWPSAANNALLGAISPDASGTKLMLVIPKLSVVVDATLAAK